MEKHLIFVQNHIGTSLVRSHIILCVPERRQQIIMYNIGTLI